mgnify:CR=1 FL=1
MGNFSTTGCNIPSVTFSTEQKEVIQQVINGNAFKNPVKNNIEGASAAASNLITLIAATDDPTKYSTIKTRLENLQTQLTTYLTHSNRLSGADLTLSGPAGEPGLDGLMGIATAHNAVYESMTGGTEDNYSLLFNSILGPSKSELNSIEQLMSGDIANYVRTDLPDDDSDALYTASVTQSKTALETLITNDNTAYSNATQTLKKYNLGNALISSVNDPCFNGTIVDKVASQLIKEKLNALP